MHPKHFTHYPYSLHSSKEYKELRSVGVRPYSSLRAPPRQAPPAAAAAEVLKEAMVVGNTLFETTVGLLRAEVPEITGIVPQCLKQDFHHGSRAKYGKRALFRFTVLAGEVDRVLQWNQHVLLCPEFIWVFPQEEDVSIFTEAVALMRRAGFLKQGALTFERARVRGAGASSDASPNNNNDDDDEGSNDAAAQGRVTT
ncbi:Hypothetical protein, putative [Bodo saltans]|uniref:Uncharacterized protein n=1 Tax=Bodo saltans TaxID=75058 RepID=A0A0S4KJ07_BODSA|nr:Hypothetical protein, putative [Bodo saltans]|eukprot:CUI14361.1 Hypothetical protein, putative [Bodo saltans]